MLAASSASPDSDAGRSDAAGPVGPNAANGAFGFKLVGTLVGVFARSRSLAAGMGAYGAARSIYAHFLARGRNVNYPKDMSMVLALGPRDKKAGKSDATAQSQTPGINQALLSAAVSATN